MGYMHIDNLYKNKAILLLRECYAMEKIHGTSAHVAWRQGDVHYHHGGEKRENFLACFNHEALVEAFKAHSMPECVIYGEAYGGKQQKQAHRYGPVTKFVAFDVALGSEHRWLEVPTAHAVCTKLGIEFVHYVRTSTDIDNLNTLRDGFSEQARRNGMGDHTQEGLVLRPLQELLLPHGNARLICKHKRDDFRETFQPRKVTPPDGPTLEILQAAEAIALEWVTPMRLEHVLQRVTERGPEATRAVIDAMLEDVLREGAGEIVDSRETRKAISGAAAKLYKDWMQKELSAAE